MIERQTHRLGIAFVGLAALVVAVMFSSTPLVADLLDVVLALLGNDYFLAVALGAVTVLMALVVYGLGHGSLHQATMPDAERPVTGPPAGSAFDAEIDTWRFDVPYLGRHRREAARDRLRTAAISATVAARNSRRSAAVDAVDTGQWTEDDVAAAYLASSGRGSTAADWVSALRHGTGAETFRVRRTIEAIASVDDDSTGGASSEPPQPVRSPGAAGSSPPKATESRAAADATADRSAAGWSGGRAPRTDQEPVHTDRRTVEGND